MGSPSRFSARMSKEELEELDWAIDILGYKSRTEWLRTKWRETKRQAERKAKSEKSRI